MRKTKNFWGKTMALILFSSLILGNIKIVVADDNTNIAAATTGAVAIHGGTTGGNGTAANLNDANYTNVDYQDGSSGQWFGIDFTSAKAFNKVVYYVAATTAGTASRITGARIEISDDKVVWKAISGTTNVNTNTQTLFGTAKTYVTTVTFATKTARYVRVYCTACANPQMREIEVFKTAAEPTTGLLMLGDYVRMGKYQDTPILWRVVDLDPTFGPLLISDQILCQKEFDAAGSVLTGSHSRDAVTPTRQISGSNFWADSDLRTWLNSTDLSISNWPCGNSPANYKGEKGFLSPDNFTVSELNVMKPVNQKTLVSIYDQPLDTSTSLGISAVTGTAALTYSSPIASVVANYDTTAYGHNVTDKMFVPDVKQIKKINDNSATLGSNYWVGTFSAYAATQRNTTQGTLGYSWTRTPDTNNASSVRISATNATVTSTQASTYNLLGVRPAFYMDESVIRFIAGTGAVASPLVADNAAVIEDCVNIFKNMNKDISMGTSLLAFPTLPNGFSAVINTSSNTNIIGLNGAITPSQQDATVELTFLITKDSTGQQLTTPPISFTIHRIIPIEEELAKLSADINKRVYIDSKKLRIPTLDSGFNCKVIQSSDTSVIDLQGAVVPPSVEKQVNVTFELTRTFDNTSIQSEPILITVPKATNANDIAFYKDLKYGMFVHYVYKGDGVGLSVYNDGTYAANIQQFEANVDAVKFASDCEAFGLQYVIFTAWHARTNPLYPSEVHKKYRHIATDVPDKDILMPVVDELNKKGIKVIFYTHPNDAHDFDAIDQASFGYYTDYASVLKINYDKWNDYISELYGELCTRYKGKISGLWVDEGLVYIRNDAAVDYERLRDTVKGIDPSIIMIANNQKGTKYTCDTVMQEDPFKVFNSDISTWKGFSPQSVVNVIGSGRWIASNPNTTDVPLGDPVSLYRYAVYEASYNYDGGGYSIAAGPYIGLSEWEKGVANAMTTVGNFIKPIKSALFETRPSTSYPTTAAKFGDLTWGVALKSKDDSKEYIHVLKPQAGKTLTLPAPADNKKFKSARLLNVTGGVTLSQTNNAVTLTLSDNVNWDVNNTVIELDVLDLVSDVTFNLSSLTANSLLQATVNVTSNTNIENSVVSIMALYDENGKLIKVDEKNIVVPRLSTQNFGLSFSLPERTANCKVKVFVWKNSLQPIGKPAELQ